MTMNMVEILPVSISILSLAVSVVVAWLTLLRSGTVRMTQPTSIYFGPDGAKGDGDLKVVVRTLLYSTAHRGRIIESMYVKLRRGESLQTFNIWVCGDDRLGRGSGLYVGREGITYGHHFLLPRDGTPFEFLPGDYEISVHATVVGKRTSLPLHKINVSLDGAAAAAMKAKGVGTFFEWGPDSGKYSSHLHNHLERYHEKRMNDEMDMMTLGFLRPHADSKKI